MKLITIAYYYGFVIKITIRLNTIILLIIGIMNLLLNKFHILYYIPPMCRKQKILLHDTIIFTAANSLIPQKPPRVRF